jgi:hypothetical protein
VQESRRTAVDANHVVIAYSIKGAPVLKKLLSVCLVVGLLISPVPAISFEKGTDTVVFNVQNHKFHDPHCIWAKRCTVNCINMTRKEAHKRGGIPCKVCGGGET